LVKKNNFLYLRNTIITFKLTFLYFTIFLILKSGIQNLFILIPSLFIIYWIWATYHSVTPLSGWFVLRPYRKMVVLVQGFSASASSMIYHATALAQKGIRAFLINLQTHGRSQGRSSAVEIMKIFMNIRKRSLSFFPTRLPPQNKVISKAC
jgi:hypothetical protein